MEAPKPSSLIQPLGSDESWTDESGTLWTRPTAWAYAQACKALHKQQDEFLASLSGIKVDRLRVQELSLRMIRASGKLMLALAGGTNSQSTESLMKEADQLISLDHEETPLPLLDEKELAFLRVKLKKKEDACEKLGAQLKEALAECKRLAEKSVTLEQQLVQLRIEKVEGSASPATHQARYEARQHLAATINEPSTRFAEELPPMADHLERWAHDAMERRLFVDQLKGYLTERGRSELKDLLQKIEEEERNDAE